MLALVLAAGGAIFAADMPMPPASQPAFPACCGDACKKMGAGCCKADDKGKVTCSMGGKCCVKPATPPAGSMPGMGGMNLGGMSMGGCCMGG